jgi:hypothetical protein
MPAAGLSAIQYHQGVSYEKVEIMGGSPHGIFRRNRNRRGWTGLYARHAIRAIFQEGPSATARLVTKKVAHDLDLSVSQQAMVGKTVEATLYRLQELRLTYRPEAEKIVFEGVAGIKRDLTPEQQQKMDLLYERFRERWQARANKRGH